MTVRVGVDIGGTFTDVALEHPGGLSTAKVLTDYAEPGAAILEGIRIAAGRAGVRAQDIGQVIHGTTLVTNALIERRGARMAFVTTEGFRDVIEMRSENRFEQYDLNLRLPDPLVPREHRLTVAERMSPEGEVLLALEDAEVARVVAEVVAGGYEAVAVGFLHSYANDAHERAVGEALRRAVPRLAVSLSSVVSPQMRELPRFNTVCANAYVQPRVADYLGRLVARLREAGIGAPVFLMHSGGGLMSVETAMEQPVRLLESGPAGGAIYAAGYARAHGVERALSFDMGGTTAKICLVEGGAPKTANLFEIARTYRFKKGSGMVVSTPVVEMVEIGAGGGSIASVDAMGRIQVGPRSAGSEPGPACYRRGGEAPTVTDANLLLGRIDAESFAGGAIPLEAALAERAVAAGLGGLGLSVAEAAFGVTEMVDENMANAARVHAVENGRDIEGVHDGGLWRGRALARLPAGREAGDRAADRAAGGGRGFGHRVPARALQLRGDAGAVPAARCVRGGGGERRARADAGGGGGVRGAGRGEPGCRGAADGLHALFRAGLGDRGAAGVAGVLGGGCARDPRGLRGGLCAVVRAGGGAAGGRDHQLVAGGGDAAPEVARVAVRTGGAEAPVVRMRGVFDAALRREVAAKEVRREEFVTGLAVDGPAVIVEEETSTVVTSAFRAVAQEDGAILILRKEA
jgi:N-methylhydantoinase A